MDKEKAELLNSQSNLDQYFGSFNDKETGSYPYEIN
jgi:hypothetical protein